MVRLNIVPYALPCTKRGQIYFLSGIREGIIASFTDGNHTYYGEYAPYPGIHVHTMADALRMLNNCRLPSDFLARGFVSSYPAPVDYVVSMMHAHHDCISSPNMYAQRAISLSALIDGGDSKEAIMQAHNCIAQGYTCLKIKVSADIKQEIQKINAIASLAGSHVTLRLDANKKLTLADGRSLLKGVQKIPLEYFEEPTQNFTDSHILYEEFGVPIAIDESLQHPFDEEQLKASRAQFVIIKPSRADSVYQVMSLARQAQAMGVTPIFSTTFESDFCVAITVLIVERLELFNRAHGIIADGMFKASPFINPLRSMRGAITVSAAYEFLKAVGSRPIG